MAQSYPVPSRVTFVSYFTFRTVPAARLFFTLSLSFGLAGLSFHAYGAEALQPGPAAVTSPDIDEESIDDGDGDGDDGSSALPDLLKTLNPEDVQEITLEEEQALLGNWGDTDTEAEDGD